MENTKQNVYILTKEGRQYTDNALIQITKLLLENKQVDPNAIPEFIAGQLLNDPEYLAEKLSTKTDSIVVLVTDEETSTLSGEPVMTELAQELKQKPKTISWQTIYDYIERKTT